MPQPQANAGAPPCAPPDFNPRKPKVALPARSCDCHAHILGPAARYAYSPARVYTPPDCLLPDYQHMLKTLGLERAVLVQPSVYGTDDTVMLEAIEAAGDRFRGVAVVNDDISDAELRTLHDAGVRGVRVNIVDVKERKPGTLPLDSLKRLAQRIKPLGWHVEFLMHVDEFPDLDRTFADFPVDIVVGHLGYMGTDKGLDAAGFQALLRLVKSGRCWVKLTGPYRISTTALPHPDVTPFAHALTKTNPERIVWGSDWPHVMAKGAMSNDGDLCDLLSEWIPDAATREQVLVHNPAPLYGFR
ncbi:MAG: GntR family transcriptional regulator [Betaproteobacteria bacterium RIFCSPLOWO2_12_FULL_62_13]|nr:MAG: GntR family transcriptional regulator [Betaproteobacteria bacterium RIFCSPLOWO2_12_FULL_62_13]